MEEAAPIDPHARLDAILAAERFDALEAERRRRLRQCGWVAGVAAAALLLLVLSDPMNAMLLGLPVLGLAAGAFWLLNREYGRAARKALMPAVCRAIGDIEHRTGAQGAPLAQLRAARMLADWSKEDVDDVFEGIWRQTLFLLAEADLKMVRGSGKNSSSRTVFKGLVFFIETPKPIAPQILLRARRPPLLGPRRPRRRELGKLERAAVPHDGFSRRFEMWSNYPPAALEVVTPAFAELMAHLSATAGWLGLDAAFTRTHLILALPRSGDRFAVGSLLRPAARLGDDAHRALDEVLAAHRLIDLLHDGPAPQKEAQARLVEIPTDR